MSARKVIEKQLKIGQVDICNIQIDLRFRNEIPQLILGLQSIYKDCQVREEVFAILEGIKERGQFTIKALKIISYYYKYLAQFETRRLATTMKGFGAAAY